MSDGQPRDWRMLAELAAAESDPEKLLALVTELNEMLDSYSVKPPEAAAAATVLERRTRPRAS